jgi:large subunit ribosomal protein L21
MAMHAVIKTGGKQYRVQPGDELVIEKIEADKGQQIVFEEVLAVGEGETLRIGTPQVAGAKVTATVVVQGKARKVIIFKKNRRKRYKVKRGHRQQFTRVKITEVVA